MRKTLIRNVAAFLMVFLYIGVRATPLSAVVNQPSPRDRSEVPYQEPQEIVVLLHGALKSAYSMKRLQNAFAHRGYLTFNWNYDSRNHTVEQNAALLDSIVLARGYDHRVMHFVTHSMGALVVRYYLEHYPPPHQGRFVMIAPPNQGSRLATELQDFPPFRWIYKDNVDHLLMGKNAFAPNIGIPDCEFGIIAGGTGGKYGFTWYLPGDDDSILSVAQTRLPGAADFLVEEHVHATIMWEDDTIRNTLHFIKYGRFIHSDNLTWHEQKGRTSWK